MPDPTYQKTIPGTKTLKQLSRLIHQEECEALSAFQTSVIAVIGVNAVNLLTFKEVGVTDVPDECELVKKGDSAPDGGTKEWFGIMISSGKTIPVDLYRIPEE